MNELQAVRSKGCRDADLQQKIFRPSKLQSSLTSLDLSVFGFQEVNRLTHKNIQLRVHEKMDPSIFFRDFEVKKPMDLRVSMLYNCCWECIRNHCCDIGRPRHAPGPRRNNLSLDRLKGNSWCSNLILGLKLFAEIAFCWKSRMWKVVFWIQTCLSSGFRLLFKVYIFLKAFGGNQ